MPPQTVYLNNMTDVGGYTVDVSHNDGISAAVDVLTLPFATAGGITSYTQIAVECQTCHRFQEKSATGTVLWRASAEACTACHDASAAPKLQAYQAELKAALKELESAAKRVREALKAATVKEGQSAPSAAQLDDVEHDLNFLRAANGVHNVHYATSLTGRVLERVSALCRQLKIPEPKAKLPRRVDGLGSGEETKPAPFLQKQGRRVPTSPSGRLGIHPPGV